VAHLDLREGILANGIAVPVDAQFGDSLAIMYTAAAKDRKLNLVGKDGKRKRIWGEFRLLPWALG
jgi:hypothetical protein